MNRPCRLPVLLLLLTGLAFPLEGARAQDAPHPVPGKTPATGGEADGAKEAKANAEKSDEDSKEKESGLRIVALTKRSHAAVAPASGANAGFIVGDEAVLVVDTLGTPERAKLLLAEIAKVTKKPVRHLVYTHWHLDHTVGGKEFPEGVSIHGTPGTTKAIASNLKKFRDMTRSGVKGHGGVEVPKVVLPNRTVTGEAEIDLGGITVRLLDAGHGHSRSDLVVWVPSEKVMFTGDLVNAGLHPVLSEAKTFQWISALAQLEGLEPEKVVPGRGQPGDGDLVGAQLKYLMTLRRALKHLVKRGASINDILTKFKVPEEWKDLGNAGVWNDNLAYVIREMADGG